MILFLIICPNYCVSVGLGTFRVPAAVFAHGSVQKPTPGFPI